MGRMEIFTGQERRRFWSDERKLSILADVNRHAKLTPILG